MSQGVRAAQSIPIRLLSQYDPLTVSNDASRGAIRSSPWPAQPSTLRPPFLGRPSLSLYPTSELVRPSFRRRHMDLDPKPLPLWAGGYSHGKGRS